MTMQDFLASGLVFRIGEQRLEENHIFRPEERLADTTVNHEKGAEKKIPALKRAGDAYMQGLGL